MLILQWIGDPIHWYMMPKCFLLWWCLPSPSCQLSYHTHQQWINNKKKRRFSSSLSNQIETKHKQEYDINIKHISQPSNEQIYIRLTKGFQRLLKTSELFGGWCTSSCKAIGHTKAAAITIQLFCCVSLKFSFQESIVILPLRNNTIPCNKFV